ncbi:MAG: cell envelope integrity protein TolA [Deltaproteobacteria bacterium]|nr:MAG: cell envelope integrity protein TolA [Deltaproteobacteria bacterium]
MALVIAALLVSPLFGTPLRLEPVAVVDLIGGGEFRQKAEKPPLPAASGDEKPAPRDRTASARPPAKRGKRTKAASDDLVPPKRPAADAASLNERLRKMREARSDSEAVREAVEERRSEAAARAAVRKVGERVAHRIESPPPARSSGRETAGGGGGQGTVRVSPELLDYFRRLEERVRSSWVLPGTLVRDAGKLVVEMRIVIEKDGRVSEDRIGRGSGNLFFDESVQRAIRKASPLPIPPEQLRGGEDHYEVGFRFHGGGQ